MNIFKKHIIEDNAEFEALKAEHATLLEQFDSIKDELKTAQEQAAHYQLEFTALTEQFETLTKEKEEVEEDNAELAAVDTNVDMRASIIAANVVAEQIGEPPVAITDDTEQLSITDGLATLKGKELVAFYKKHKQEIFKSLKKSN